MAGRVNSKEHLVVDRTKSLAMLTPKPFHCRSGSLNLCALGLVGVADRLEEKYILSLI
jgi:hypothetical protein